MNDKPQNGQPLFNPFASEEITPAFSEHWQAKRRVAQAIRDLTDVLVTSAPPTEDMHAMAEKLEQQAIELAKSKRLYGLMEFMRDGEHGKHGEVNHELNGVGGWSNPISPGLNMWVEGDKAYGKVTCGHAYEGPPGYVHGGHVAAIFDQFLGMAQIVGKQPGMTGVLTIRYLKPTPLNTELDLEADITVLEGRKTRVTGTMTAGDVITATCEGLFIKPKTGISLPRS